MQPIKTQLDAVKYLLENNKFITSWQAIEAYGITRLSHYIYLLRREGWVINTEEIKFINCFDNPGQYAKYILISKPKITE